MNAIQYTITIESAVLGGSCCLSNGTEIVAEERGSGGVSRAEDLLSDIDSILKANALAPSAISNIVVSAGPGSFTGIRIGIATALGFASGLGIASIQVSLLEAMAVASTDIEPCLVAVPAGRGMAHYAVFAISDDAIVYITEPSAAKIEDLFSESNCSNITVFQDHFDNELLDSFAGNVLSLEQTPAATLAIAAFDKRVRRNVEPLLIAKA
ncbi:MAG TPA: tRNA (adenosine(37)-N6)-threonylcarbamoyltransferase complex dimerization subunit type 1 TsaB [Pyrinomonadaceae bacterium]|nr:tRNA (adenosine(37)-N6)-threonylcarbamoyltransferase complex dimerization subunit type 1 TsaB [Pyrinomonadaceae bacterium]